MILFVGWLVLVVAVSIAAVVDIVFAIRENL